MKRGIVVVTAVAMTTLIITMSLSLLARSGSPVVDIDSSEYRATCEQREGAINTIVRIHPLPESIDFAGESVPLERNYVQEALEREILTTASMHTSTMLTLRRTTRYFPIIEPILAEYGVPNDFKYLALAESGLNENALSSAQAAGVWQFIKSTGKEYGMESNGDVDMRYHIETATRAACQYLLSSYEEFGSWTLAAASYNLGSAGVKRRLEIQSVTNYWDLFLPEETMRYLPRIVAFKIFLESPSRYGFHLEEGDYFEPFTAYKEVEISEKDIDWSKFAAQHGTTYRILRILNPWIRSYTYSNPKAQSYVVKIPTAEFIP